MFYRIRLITKDKPRLNMILFNFIKQFEFNIFIIIYTYLIIILILNNFIIIW